MTNRLDNESLDEFYSRLRERSDREDLVMFINACFAATRQNEFYTDRYEQSFSIDFLHQYMLANYRRIYARCVAAGINDYNRAQIILNLLDSGAPSNVQQRSEEGELIAVAMQRLPANRAYGLMKALQRQRVNNRRTRAVVKRYLRWRREPEFDAIKYRNKFRAAASHAHVAIDPEIGEFLFARQTPRRYQNELLETYRHAHYDASAIYQLPFTVAESLAAKHKVPRDVFFRKIGHKMTMAEKLRYQNASAKTKGGSVQMDLGRAPLTRLALYVMSLPIAQRVERSAELHRALESASERTRAKSPLSLGRVAAVLDRSRSASGSREKRNRPHAVALASSYFLRVAAREYRAFWTPVCDSASHEFLHLPSGQTSVAETLIDALQWNPDLIVIVSDGFENDPPQAADQIVNVYRDKIASDQGPAIVHMNPVFDADHFSPRSLGQSIPTVGLRNAADITTMLGFTRFASGADLLADLEEYLGERAADYLASKT